jgi:hypothetical protein
MVEAEVENAALVEYIWRANEQVVRSLLDWEGEYDQERFAEAIDFFERVTSIMSDTHTYFGTIPTSQLPEALAQWDRWYEENRHSLRVDPLSCRILVVAESSP